MKKYVIDKKEDKNTHWEYCEENDIPYIVIYPAKKFSKIEFDVYTMFGFHKPTSHPSDSIIEIYKSYCLLFNFPDDKMSCIGGSNNLIFVVFEEHSEFIANQLFDYLYNFVKSNRKSG